MSETTQGNCSANKQTLYMAMELGGSSWKLAFGTGGGKRVRMRTIEARAVEQLLQEVAAAKKRFGLADDVKVVSCYEAGRDGYWVHRMVTERGIDNQIVDSSSIEVSRRRRRAKTDRLDAKKLLAMLIRYAGGERDVWSVLRVPRDADEDAQRLYREIKRLQKERNAHRSRIKGLLATQGIVLETLAKLDGRLDSIRRWDEQPLGPGLKRELRGELERLSVVERQLAERASYRRTVLQEQQAIEQQSAAASETTTPEVPPESAAKVLKLAQLRGIGTVSAWPLVMELFGWRVFSNRGEVGSLVGLDATPYRSDGTSREQGISKSGNAWIRPLMVELAWLWLRYQPSNSISRWYQQRFGQGSSRPRRVGIVAVARRLLIALWRWVEHDVVPEGAELKLAVVVQ